MPLIFCLNRPYGFSSQKNRRPKLPFVERVFSHTLRPLDRTLKFPRTPGRFGRIELSQILLVSPPLSLLDSNLSDLLPPLVICTSKGRTFRQSLRPEVDVVSLNLV